MFEPTFKLNLILSWLWILLGFLSGMVLGLNFHREDWLGGYASYRRRLYRLAHISFFGLAAVNLLFVLTLVSLETSTPAAGLTRLASQAFALGAISMPICCVIAAHKKDARVFFALPVASLLAGGACTLWEVIKL